MPSASAFFTVAILSYLAGSLPFGLFVAKLVRGIDIRSAGSGNIGATNVGRVLGAKWGIFVLLLDALKGLLPVLFLPMLFLKTDDLLYNHASVLCGLCTILGHMFPIWLRFKGGKGVATALGVLVVLSPYGVLAAIATFFLLFAVFRIVSLSSIFAALAFAGFQMWQLRPHIFSEENWSMGLISLLIPLLIIIRHRSNIVRLLQGKEKRFQSASKETPPNS
ncbi:Acyl-phosphate:glycerol-3-phosphate O-acyltransferase PlsY (EC 2.3.1.n3) [hydrothermal vent metagenome]|uniref:Acyl-phosphate:glycerol-3-phosphate O-acyltransferase PlsY n=1 Tax=hydrothermal vent metagenome TaxID=652676 RepID=A0A3B1DS90_9ZZZZ